MISKLLAKSRCSATTYSVRRTLITWHWTHASATCRTAEYRVVNQYLLLASPQQQTLLHLGQTGGQTDAQQMHRCVL